MLCLENKLLPQSLNVTNWNIAGCRETKMNRQKLIVKSYRNGIQWCEKGSFEQEAQVPPTTLNKVTSNLLRDLHGSIAIAICHWGQRKRTLKDKKVWVN